MMKLIGTLAMAAALFAGDESYYPFAKGNTWTYDLNGQEVITTVTGKSEGLWLIESKMGEESLGQEYLVVDEEGIKCVKVGEITFPEPILRLKFPVRKGKKWEQTISLGGTSMTFSAEIAGEETVTVKAGKFRTIRVEMKARVGDITMENTVWYANGVGMVKQVVVSYSAGVEQYTNRLELKDYTVN